MIRLTHKRPPLSNSPLDGNLPVEQQMDFLILDNTAFMSGLNLNLLKLKFPDFNLAHKFGGL